MFSSPEAIILFGGLTPINSLKTGEPPRSRLTPRERDFRCNDFSFEVGDLGGRIFATLDHSSTAMHDHLMRLKPVTEDIKAYQINHAEIERLKEQPALPLPDRTFLRFSFYSFAFFLLMFLALKWKFHWS